MAHEQHTYICIDLKDRFYASVECVDLSGLDPLTTNTVVADRSQRGRTTICLAITQAMKDLGIHNRCRLSRKFPMASTTSRPYHAYSITWKLLMCQSTVSIWNMSAP